MNPRFSNLSGSQQFGIGSKLKLRARALTRPDGVLMEHDCVQAPQAFILVERTSEAQRGSVACPQSHRNPEQSTDLLIPAPPPHASRSCQPRTLMISSTVSWVLETQRQALLFGLLRTVTAASLKICPPTPRIPLHTMCPPPPRPAAISRSLARGSAPPTFLSPTAPTGLLGQWPTCSRPLWP